MVPGRVSVIIPVYNREDYIAETIGSVLLQDHPDVELIVIDDGSTDDSYTVVERLAVEHGFTLLTHPGHVNRGQSASINLGLERCSGEYVAVLDSDDLFLPGKLTSQVRVLQERPDVGLVYGKGMGINSEGKVRFAILDDAHVEPNDPNAMLLDCYFLLPQNALVRKSVYDQVGGFDESLRSGQDHDMLVRMAEVTRFHFEPDLVFHYRRHGNSISEKGLETRWRSAFVILDKARRRYPYRAATIRKRRAVINFRLAMALFKYRRKRLEATGRLLLSGLLDPMRALRIALRLENPF